LLKKILLKPVGVVSAIQMPAVRPFGYDLISIAYNDIHDLTKIKFNYVFNNSIKTIGLIQLKQ
jgi:hypothetical protein